MAEVNFPLIIGASLIDGINPCAFGVLIFLLAYLAKTAKTKAKMLTNGLVYIAAVFITYLVAGLLLLPVLRKLGAITAGIYVAIAFIIILLGLIEIKDFFWYGKGFSLSIFPSESKRIKLYVKNISDKWYTAFGLGVFVALVELPCTGAVYVAVLTLMSLAGLTIKNFSFLLIYNFIFVLPLVAILLGAVNGISTERFQNWQQKYKKWMRLGIGLILVGLGLWMLTIIY